MHTTTIQDTTFVHNGDYSGDVKIIRGDKSFSVPFDDLRGLVANYVRESKIAALEQSDDAEILGVFEP